MSVPDSTGPKPRRSPTGQAVGPSVYKVPPGDDRERLVCAECGYIHYENPKIVVGSVIEHDGRVVLCRRAIHPRRGFWTLPAGYLESRETVVDGARREALEEACAEIEIGDLFAVYNIPRTCCAKRSPAGPKASKSPCSNGMRSPKPTSRSRPRAGRSCTIARSPANARLPCARIHRAIGAI